ncbi:MAG: hypothetical protein KBD64_00230 [Gammaproteobacteria bacterium]|nr:hypothetical protein [Gammaproteobacteria bacterium]
MNLKKIFKIETLLFVFVSQLAYAQNFDNDHIIDIGQASRNITMALDSVGQLVLSAVVVTGVGFLFAAIAKWQQHRKNPQQVTVSQVLVMVVMALVLIGLPLVIVYGDSTYNFIKTFLNNV